LLYIGNFIGDGEYNELKEELIIMIVNPRLQRRIFIYSYVFKKLGILTEQEYKQITTFSSLDENR
jgi:hypothetical protein